VWNEKKKNELHSNEMNPQYILLHHNVGDPRQTLGKIKPKSQAFRDKPVKVKKKIKCRGDQSGMGCKKVQRQKKKTRVSIDESTQENNRRK